jgi:hypothetical protein
MYLEGSNDALYAWNFRSTQLILKSVEDDITTNLWHGQDSLLTLELISSIPRDSSEDSGAYPLNMVVMDFTLS